MRVMVQGLGIPVDPALRSHVERRVGSALGRFGPKVDRVTVRLSDAGNSAVPGVRCAVTLSMADGLVKVEDSGDEPFEAVARAIDRAGRALVREVERQHEVREGIGLGPGSSSLVDREPEPMPSTPGRPRLKRTPTGGEDELGHRRRA
ncbi:HPF/RaiA family ribosome-associated protein [Tautonia sp. JC769]|uniref:HPF/RaiA family ribosome-associated protein n=1 Tax=Tautonia sp. JC769 TaxID=3232135 RepID=UPI00345A3336